MDTAEVEIPEVVLKLAAVPNIKVQGSGIYYYCRYYYY